MSGVGTRVSFTRVLHAPRVLVWAAWTDPVRLAQWWGPAGFTNPRCEVDVRPGGQIRIDMKAPDGTVYPMDGTFHEVEPPARLVFTSAALDETGARLFEELNEVTFAEVGETTELSLETTVIAIHAPIAAEYLKGMEVGWGQSLDRLADFVAGQD